MFQLKCVQGWEIMSTKLPGWPRNMPCRQCNGCGYRKSPCSVSTLNWFNYLKEMSLLGQSSSHLGLTMADGDIPEVLYWAQPGLEWVASSECLADWTWLTKVIHTLPKGDPWNHLHTSVRMSDLQISSPTCWNQATFGLLQNQIHKYFASICHRCWKTSPHCNFSCRQSQV